MTPAQDRAGLRYDPADRPIDRKERISFETVAGLDQDPDLAFQLRGGSYNPLVDAATPLLGLALRLRRMEQYDGDVQALYERVYHQVAAIGEEARQQGYDNGVLMVYRYCLCTFLDEIVMGTPWGSESPWAARSLLSAYHNETWGGEKFFTLVSRLSMEPQTFRDVLEFLYLCLCLGFKGKYRIRHDGGDELQRVTEKLHRLLRGLRGETPEGFSDRRRNVLSKRYGFQRSIAWWVPWLAVASILTVAYSVYALSLHGISAEVVRALDSVLAADSHRALLQGARP